MFEDGFVKLHRSLLNHSTILNLKDDQFRMFIKLLELLCYAPCIQDDHGVHVKLHVGQYMTTLRKFADLCGLKKPETTGKKTVERFFDRLEMGGIAHFEIQNVKTIVTILCMHNYDKNIDFQEYGKIKDEKSIQEMGQENTAQDISKVDILNNKGTRKGTRKGQERDIKEEVQERKKSTVQEAKAVSGTKLTEIQIRTIRKRYSSKSIEKAAADVKWYISQGNPVKCIYSITISRCEFYENGGHQSDDVVHCDTNPEVINGTTYK